MKNKYKILIISCWIVLAICFVIKIFGGNWFEIICENQRFIGICNWLDNSWVKYIVSTLFYTCSTYLIYLPMVNKKIGDDWWITLIVLPSSILKVYCPIVAFILDISVMITIPLIRSNFQNWLKVIVGNVSVILFQFVSLVTKDIGIYLTSESILVSIILSIDYYIMILLYFLYNRKYCKKGE